MSTTSVETPTKFPHIQRLEDALAQCNAIEFVVTIDLPDRSFELTVMPYKNKSQGFALRTGQGAVYDSWDNAKTLEIAMVEKTSKWRHGKMRPESLRLKAIGSSVPEEVLKVLARAAWCEAFGRDIPTENDLSEREVEFQQEQQQRQQAVLADLQGGDVGVARWNARPQYVRSNAKLRRLDLCSAYLRKANLATLNMERASFDNADLKEANLERGKYQKASFRNAQLHGAKAAMGSFQSACLEGADLAAALLRSSNFRKANLRNARLVKADLRRTCLCGAELSGAVLADAQLDGAQYDESTRFPEGFRLTQGMRWVGKGLNPHLPNAADKPATPIDMETFLDWLRLHVGEARLGKAMKLLKRNRFTLFTQVKDDTMIGVVRSHATPGLVYACRLASAGRFGCCTHYLHSCSQQGGKMCHHVLVLLVGLAQSGQIDLARVAGWVEDSVYMHPDVNREDMSEVLLRYKGAEACEIDWRPTETIPEDFYAY
jgi:Pentapeptide repeats (8 copies)